MNEIIHTASSTDALLDRQALAHRWGCSIETIKRREKDGTLTPVHLPGGRLVRYRLNNIIQAEGGAQ
jgi:predicted site-specific integrase-resolvase